jgi:mono/diheme cytochrome c family protein
MRLLAVIGLAAILVALAGGIYFFGGYYNVSAAVEDPGLLQWTVGRVREASMDRQSEAVGEPPFKLDDPQMVRAGAREFAEHGCQTCHGAPGVTAAGLSKGLNPEPPNLKEVADDEPGHIFWAIKNGIRMTGMPSFGKAGVDDKDIWEIAAFIKKLPDVSDADYKSWTVATGH